VTYQRESWLPNVTAQASPAPPQYQCRQLFLWRSDSRNLLPAHFRHPYWARGAREHGSDDGLSRQSKYLQYEDDILLWDAGTHTREAAAGRWVGFEIPEEWKVNTAERLLFKLRAILDELPLALQAFILRDGFGPLAKDSTHGQSAMSRNLLKPLRDSATGQCEYYAILRSFRPSIATNLPQNLEEDRNIDLPNAGSIQWPVYQK
jgi:hypothetical protein